MTWSTVKYSYGDSVVRGGRAHDYMREAHVIPVGDKRMHTIPMCWCGPKMDGKSSCVFTHKASDPRL